MDAFKIGIGLASLALIGFSILGWRYSSRISLKALFCVMASAGIGLVSSNSMLTLVAIATFCVLIFVTWLLVTKHYSSKLTIRLWIVCLISILIVSRFPQIGLGISPAIWIGISYLIFRLIHMSLDSQRQNFSGTTLPETFIYVLHPATLIAGPIDRIQHNIAQQRNQQLANPSEYINEGIWRFLFGLFKKIGLANLCFAIMTTYDITTVTPSRSAAWIWMIAYSFYIYFDFAGYSDMAIGAGLLMGMRLPENFSNPYMSSTVTRFWQTWHITLSTWLRDYIFFPLSRTLLKRFGSRFSSAIILISHLTTMAICGLWHGIRLELLVWGLWHGIGLYAHNRWTNLRKQFSLPAFPTIIAIPLTFLFVSLGWLFFSQPLVHASSVMLHMVGLR